MVSDPAEVNEEMQGVLGKKIGGMDRGTFGEIGGMRVRVTYESIPTAKCSAERSYLGITTGME